MNTEELIEVLDDIAEYAWDRYEDSDDPDIYGKFLEWYDAATQVIDMLARMKETDIDEFDD